jgi:hypothetical protein
MFRIFITFSVSCSRFRSSQRHRQHQQHSRSYIDWQSADFSFNYDATTNTVIGTPSIDFMGMVFTYSPASLIPLDFDFTSGVNEIIIGDIGEFPQPGINGFPAVGTYPGVLVGYGSPTPTFAAYNGSAVVSAVPEPGVLTLLAVGLLFAPVLPRRRQR